MSPAPAPLLDVRDLVTEFPAPWRPFGCATPVRAVDGVSFSVPRGAIVGLVGESGSGKTTIARSILRLIPVRAGEVHLGGAGGHGSVDLLRLGPAELHAIRPRLQMIFQDPSSSLNPRHTVGAIVGRPMALHGRLPAGDRGEAVAGLLARVGLGPELASRLPHELSGGQRQRVGIARALGVGPELLVCDEAVSALDVSVRAQVLNLLMDLRAELGLALLFVSHDLSVVRHVADRVVVLQRGRVVEDAPRDALFHDPQHPYTRALLAAAPPPPGFPEVRRGSEKR